ELVSFVVTEKDCNPSPRPPPLPSPPQISGAVTGRNFGEKDFRGGLDNGILLCELLSSIKPGLVKKINRLPTPVAGLTLRNIVFDVPRHPWSPEC
uniref:Calponin-homology (CH) domain-containing protein n=1 Tax=Astyanax mexicanus TaxID=7994 RepID=A0A3B1ID47_ASTMX